MLAGIGSTMCCFIGIPACSDPVNARRVHFGVHIASPVAASTGFVVLRHACPIPMTSRERQP